MELHFTKMHGLGNDFVVLDLITNPVQLCTDDIRTLGDRHFGIGFDQLLMIEPPNQPDVDFNYRIFNADGGEVEHCGNGARCFVRFVIDKGLTSKKSIRVKTMNGIIVLSIQEDGLVVVDMGAPSFRPASLPFKAEQAPAYTRRINVEGEQREVTFHALSVGNPHAVLVVDDLDATPVQEIGKALGSHPDFPRGVNVGFMEVLDRRNIRLRVYERGAGETIACGTGACAAATAGIAAGLLDNQVRARLTGGDLQIDWAGQGQSIIMRGPATTVYEGVIHLHRSKRA